MGLRILLIQTYFPEFLERLYAERPALADLEFDEQRRRILQSACAIGDAYSSGLRRLGCEAVDVIVNADRMQQRWANEHRLDLTGNLHDRRRQIVAAQIDHHRPDVLYVFEWCPLGDGFLQAIKPRVRALVGQIASPLHPDRSYAGYDLMVSSWPPIVDYFRRAGKAAQPLRLGFDARIIDRLNSEQPRWDVTFAGGFAPSHGDRIQWLERLLGRIDIDVFGYGVEKTSATSPIRSRHHGPVWGLEMYETLQRSRITLNRHAHIDVRGSVSMRFANNMRLYEATGVGACLLTDQRDNLAELFEPGREILAYKDDAECVEIIQHYLTHDQERRSIAQAGRQRTLRDHTYDMRMRELLDLIRARI